MYKDAQESKPGGAVVGVYAGFLLLGRPVSDGFTASVINEYDDLKANTISCSLPGEAACLLEASVNSMVRNQVKAANWAQPMLRALPRSQWLARP